jgi:tetraacyldisaccharide 4'-kinase
MNKTSRLQQWLENIWYNNGKGRFILLPLSALYCAINRYQRKKQTKNLPTLPCPVIVIGNITVGGTGKTPLTIHIAKLLEEEGYKPAIITRGYGGEATQWPQSVTAQTDPKQVGDEAVLMAARTHIPVYAGANRLQSIDQLLKAHDCDVIISDDGMQHYKLPRDIQIAVIDATRLFGNGYCLPAGPLREKKERLDRCDLVVVNGSESPQKSWLKMMLEGDTLINLKTGQKKALKDFAANKVNAVTGIGNPQRFYQTLKQGGLNLSTRSFPDHHNFQALDLGFDNQLEIIMTEKDAVKCKSFAKESMWYLPVTAKMDKRFKDALFAQLNQLLKKGGGAI